jgi:hypothetical protein
VLPTKGDVVARLGRWTALLTLVVGGLTVAPPASAAPPDCDVRTYAADDVLELREDKPWGIRVECWSEGTSEELTVHRAPDHGSVGTPHVDEQLPEEWVVPYDPADGYLGDDSLVLRVSDGTETALIAVAIRITPNRDPGCDQRNGGELYGHAEVDDTAEWWVACGDPDLQDYGDLQAVTEQAPAHGTLEVSAGIDPQTYEERLTVVYTPEPGFEGSDHFSAGMTDGDLTDSYGFFVNVSDGPWCRQSEPVEVRAGDTVLVLPDCSAPTPEQLVTSVPTPPEHGSTSLVGMAIDYTADADASGLDSFTFQASGSDGVSNVVTQEVTILPNAAPACDDVAVETARDAAVAVPLTCADPDGDDHDVAIADQPEHGTLDELVDGSVTYTPDPGWDGTDRFTYVASDDARTSAPATVMVEVTEQDAPVVDVTVPDQSPARAARRGLRILVGPDEPVTADVVVDISDRLAERLGIPGRIGRLRGVTIEQPRRVTVDLTRRASRAIRPLGRVRLVVDVVARDAWGNAASVGTRGVLR